MRRQMLFAGIVALAHASASFAQLPPAKQPAPFPGLPKPMVQPKPALPTAPALPDGSVLSQPRVETPLPREEAKFAFDSAQVAAKKINGVWQIWMGQQPLRVVADENAARDVVRLYQDMRPTEWAEIGSPRPIVEYGLVNGRPPSSTGLPRGVVPIDLRSVRLEPVKGVWCLRDDANILFNFGLNKTDGEQTLGVVRKYGFNRIGVLGDVNAPAMTYFFVALEPEGPPKMKSTVAAALQEHNLNRTGIPVPGVGYIGEISRIDWRKTDVKRDGTDWVLVCGTETIAKFGHDESGARDAMRMVKDGQFSEFARIGPAGANFFLASGQVPMRLPLFVQGRRIDVTALKTMQSAAGWSVTERGRHVFTVASAEEGDAVIRLMKQFGFDQLCRIGQSPNTNLTFLAKGK